MLLKGMFTKWTVVPLMVLDFYLKNEMKCENVVYEYFVYFDNFVGLIETLFFGKLFAL